MGSWRKVLLRRWHSSKKLCTKEKWAVSLWRRTLEAAYQTSLMPPWGPLGLICVLFQFRMDFDGYNFFPSAPGLLVDTAADPRVLKPTLAQVGIAEELMPMRINFNKAKEEPVDKFLPLNVPRNIRLKVQSLNQTPDCTEWNPPQYALVLCFPPFLFLFSLFFLFPGMGLLENIM